MVYTRNTSLLLRNKKLNGYKKGFKTVLANGLRMPYTQMPKFFWGMSAGEFYSFTKSFGSITILIV